MKNVLTVSTLAAAFAAPGMVLAAPAAKPSASQTNANTQEISEIRAQMQALSERLQRLEQSNDALQTENAELKKSADQATKTAKQVQSESDATIDQLAKTRAALPEWVSRIGVKGDFRYRHEDIETNKDSLGATPVATQDRERERIRARLAITAKVTDTITVGTRLVTSEANQDPRSPNVTLSGYNVKKTVGFDQAYVEWAPIADFRLTGGKMVYPYSRPALSSFYDPDINPEGVAANYSHGYLFANAFYFWLNEVTTAQTDRADAKRVGGQLGIKYPFTANDALTVAAMYTQDGSVQGRLTSTFFAGSTNGNSTVTIGTGPTATTVLRDEFKIAEAFAEYTHNLSTSTFGDLPLSVYGEYAKNTGADDLDKAYSGGIGLGKASAPGTWEVSYMYEKLEKNALFGQWIDSDFGGGNTDIKGHALRAGYAPLKNTVLNLTYFINKINIDAPTAANPRRNYDRLQVDFNFKF